ARERTAAVREPVRLRKAMRSNGVMMMTDAGGSFVEYVKQQLLADPALGSTREQRTRTLFDGGLRTYTTLDLPAEREAERAIRNVLNKKGDPSAALVSIEPSTGAIRAMAGGTDARGFNLAAQGRRQPGSAFKPFTLVAALEDGISVYKNYNGSDPRTIDLGNGESWIVHNYEGSHGGYMSLLEATEFSVNAVYAQVAVEVGPKKVVGVAERMGITSHLDAYPSIALGALTIGVSPMEMASAYGTLANGGASMKPFAIAKVEDVRRSVVLTRAPIGKQVLEREIAEKATAVLEKVIESGTGRSALALGRPAAGKTGTTDDYRDSWFVGFTPQLSTAVWLGYPTVSRPLANIHGLPHVFGGSLPCEIWTRFMRAALADQPVVDFATVDLHGGDAAGGRGSSVTLSEPVPAPAPVRRHGNKKH
ncbi:MAG: transglycosylase domain-containing protein, partial [Actinomycetota bacterium]